MRIFVTGASGHIAAAVIPELLNNGHEVVGLARSQDSAAAVSALGAEVRRGDLDDLDGLQQAASEADGVIHLAFKHEASPVTTSPSRAHRHPGNARTRAADRDDRARKAEGPVGAGLGHIFPGCLNGVVVPSSTNPSRLRIGRLAGEASTWR